MPTDDDLKRALAAAQQCCRDDLYTIAKLSDDVTTANDALIATRKLHHYWKERAEAAEQNPSAVVAFMFLVREDGKGCGREFAAIDYIEQPGETILSKRPLVYAKRTVLGTEKGLTPAGQHIADCERDAELRQSD